MIAKLWLKNHCSGRYLVISLWQRYTDVLNATFSPFKRTKWRTRSTKFKWTSKIKDREDEDQDKQDERDTQRKRQARTVKREEWQRENFLSSTHALSSSIMSIISMNCPMTGMIHTWISNRASHFTLLLMCVCAPCITYIVWTKTCIHTPYCGELVFLMGTKCWFAPCKSLNFSDDLALG